MKYLILLYGNPTTREWWTGLTDAERVEAARGHAALTEQLAASGELIMSSALTDPSVTRRVTVRDGRVTTTDGPLAEQDRSRWDAAAIAEGVALISGALATAPLGPYQLQAAIAAVHDEAPRAEDTDWPQILGLYDVLHVLAPGPIVTLNRVVAVAMVHGPRAGLDRLAEAAADPALAGHHRVHAVRAHLQELVGDRAAARASYQLAARRTLSVPEQAYLQARAARLAVPGDRARLDRRPA